MSDRKIETLDPELFEIIDTEQLAQIIEHNVLRLREPVMVHGRAGYGKSEVIAQAAEKHGAMLVDIRLSQYETVDLRGGLGVGKEGALKGHTVWYPPSTMPFIGNDAFPDDVPILVFLDELTSATIPVLAIAYQLINEGRIGEHVLKPNVVIVCAGNLDDDKGIVVRMPGPLNNRMTHFKLLVSIEAFTAYCQSVGVPPIFIAYFWFKKDEITNFNPKAPQKVFASPRTWFKAIKYYSDPLMPDWLKRKSFGGAVGRGHAQMFYGFVDVYQNVIPLKSIIADPAGVPIPTEISLCWATAMNVCGAMSRKNVAQLAIFIARLAVEYQVMIWTMACRRDESLLTTPQFIQFSKRYRDVFSGFGS